jgi:CMP-N,N'-diacetyllegionaminic acid synthase
MRTLGLVPARGGSKGIPRKNLQEIAGRSLIAWTAASAAGSRLARVVLSTDDREIAEEASRLGLEVLMRPSELATDEALAIDVSLHAIDALQDTYDAVMLLQPTTPFRTAQDIDGALDLLEGSTADSVISVADIGGYHPERMKHLEGGVLLDPEFAEDVEGKPRQRLRPLVIRNGAIYLTRLGTLRQRSFRGRVSLGWLMPPERSINIDAPFDLELARCLAERR